jgi:hypothetical protein
VPHAGHELFGAGPRGRSKGVPGMAQIMKMQAGDPHCGAGRLPETAVEVRPALRGAVRRREHQVLRVDVGESVEVRAKDGQDVWRDGDGAPACCGLRGSEGDEPVGVFLDLAADPHRAGGGVNVGDPEPGEFPKRIPVHAATRTMAR